MELRKDYILDDGRLSLKRRRKGLSNTEFSKKKKSRP
jgi:hypothetical protein